VSQKFLQLLHEKPKIGKDYKKNFGCRQNICWIENCGILLKNKNFIKKNIKQIVP
jgi:hypothetical protein